MYGLIINNQVIEVSGLINKKLKSIVKEFDGFDIGYSDYENYEKIWHFNEVTLKDYKRFRLGYSLDGAYIRNIKFDVNEKGEITSGPYANRIVARGIYIAPKTYQLYVAFL